LYPWESNQFVTGIGGTYTVIALPWTPIILYPQGDITYEVRHDQSPWTKNSE
jgi:hypothetical protein